MIRLAKGEGKVSGDIVVKTLLNKNHLLKVITASTLTTVITSLR